MSVHFQLRRDISPSASETADIIAHTGGKRNRQSGPVVIFIFPDFFMHPVRGAKNREMENDSETRSRTASRSERPDGRPAHRGRTETALAGPDPGDRTGARASTGEAHQHPATPRRRRHGQPIRANGRTNPNLRGRTANYFIFRAGGKTWKINHRESCRITDQTDKNAKHQNQRRKMKSRTSPGTSTAADPHPGNPNRSIYRLKPHTP